MVRAMPGTWEKNHLLFSTKLMCSKWCYGRMMLGQDSTSPRPHGSCKNNNSSHTIRVCMMYLLSQMGNIRVRTYVRTLCVGKNVCPVSFIIDEWYFSLIPTHTQLKNRPIVLTTQCFFFLYIFAERVIKYMFVWKVFGVLRAQMITISVERAVLDG